MQLPLCLAPPLISWRPSNWAGGKQSECTARTSCQSLYTYAHPVCKCSRLSSTLSRSTAATLSVARASVCLSFCLPARPSVCLIVRLSACLSACLSMYVHRRLLAVDRKKLLLFELICHGRCRRHG